MDDQIEVKNNTDKQRYEAQVGEHVAELTYHRDGDKITFLHTGVPDDLEGRGVGSSLTRTALEDARTQNLNVVPECPFVAAYIQRHEEYHSLLTPEEQEHLFQK